MREVRIISACIIAALATLTARGQPNSAQPPPLAVEVHVSSGESPVYVPVPPADTLPSWIWFTRFKKTSVGTRGENSTPVTAVNIRALRASDRVMVSVSVFLAEKFDEEKTVAVYGLQEREKVTLQELRDFGVEPFDVMLVRVAVGPAPLPQVISKVNSIELVTIQDRLSTLPAYSLTLRNLSPKNVVALMIKTRQGNRILQTGMPQGEEGKALIVANGTSELFLPAAYRAEGTPGAYQPVAAANQTIEITTAAFDDGSSEGETSHATHYREVVNTRKIQLRKVIDLLQEALQGDLSDSSNAVRTLESKVGSLNSAGGIRINVMDEIRRLRLSKPDLDANAYRAWLLALKQKYAAWLARL